MIAEALDYLKGILKPNPITIDIADLTYEVDPGQHGPALGDLVAPPAKPALCLSSVTGFVDAYKAKIDDFAGGKTAIHVIDYKTVALISLEADKFGRRHEWLRSTCREENPFPFDRYQITEDFLIKLQSGFLPDDNIIVLQRLASSLTNESSIGVQDDGMAQVVTVKQGAVSRSDVVIPKRIELFAYRTFREIDPIVSEFMVRLKGEPGKLPTIALFQVDADVWKHDTQRLVAQWLKAELPDAIVLA